MNPDQIHDILAESGWEIHKVKEGPYGQKRYEKASKKDFVDTTNQVNEVAEVTEELKDATFEERYAWVEKHKDEGNTFYSEGKYGQALDKYLHALYGINFKDQTIEMEQKVNFGLKVPLLNNMSVCLLKVNEYKKVVAMTDQVLFIDPNNKKALFRRTQALLELGNVSDAKDNLEKLRPLLTDKEDNKKYADLIALYQKKHNQEKDFAQKAFQGNKTGQAESAPPPPSEVDQDEVEYLRTVSFMHWMVYPYIKALRNIMNCRRKPIPFRKEFPEMFTKEKDE